MFIKKYFKEYKELIKDTQSAILEELESKVY